MLPNLHQRGDAAQERIDALWDFNDPPASEQRFRLASEHESDVAARLEFETQLARALGLQGKFDEAHCVLDAVDQYLASQPIAFPSDHATALAGIRCSLERGRLFNSAAARENAKPLFMRAYEASLQFGNDHLAADAAHMIAIVHDAAGRSEEAMAWNRRALSIADQSVQPRARQWRASLHNNMGWTLHGLGEYAAALGHFETALECRREQNVARDIRIARWCVARTMRSLGRVEEALRIQREIADEIRCAGDESDGFNQEEIGECLLALGKPAHAVPHFRAAHQALSMGSNFAKTEASRLARLNALSKPSG